VAIETDITISDSCIKPVAEEAAPQTTAFVIFLLVGRGATAGRNGWREIFCNTKTLLNRYQLYTHTEHNVLMYQETPK
jgi:hypothetical protein